MGYLARLTQGIVGQRMELPPQLGDAFPELATLRYRRGGLPLRVGGIMLGQTTVAAITLWRTIYLAPSTRLDPELLLHEFRHVQQFYERRSFPLHYIWESLRRGYHANRYEADARGYAASRLAPTPGTGSDEDA
ncbi:MAG: hypothetical protein ABI681_09110 [Gemmatimonadales bacterium]